MNTLLTRVRRYAAEHQLWSAGNRVAVGVSGGSDSVALLFLLRELAAAGDLTLAGLAHLDHRIRGVESREDAEFCRALANRLGVPPVISEEDVPSLAAREHLSIEVAAREARHRFLAGAAAALGADRVALAHTRDDQAETVLLRLVRGAGSAGLGGIPPRRDALVRPLLDVSRGELRAYLEEQGETWREDSTNADRANPRNRMRHDVLPLLRAHFNPRTDAALARAADILRSDEALLDELAADAASRIVDASGSRVSVSWRELRALPKALARRVALKALETADPGRTYGLEEVDRLLRERSAETVVIQKRGVGQAVAHGVFDLTLPVPGAVTDPLGQWEMAARPCVPPPAVRTAAGAWEVVVDSERISEGLHVRSRRPGDRLTPLGMTGRKKIQDVFVDRKVPRDERDRVPIVTDGSGRIVWVAGHALDEGFRVTPRTTAVVMLTLRRKSAWRPS